MKPKRIFTLALACLSLVPFSASQNVASYNKVPGHVESTARRLTHELKRQGLEVNRGYFKLYTKDDCQYSFAVMKSCFGNNPAAPYVLFAVPPWPEEFIDPATVNAFGPTANGYTIPFRFDPREAIVILALLPPPGAYTGLQTYGFTREGTYSTSSVQYRIFSVLGNNLLNIFFATVPNNPERIQVLNSLSNSNNNVVIERQSGQAFGEIRFFIITPDPVMDEAIRHSFRDLGIAQKDIFTEPIPSIMRIGLDEHADDFVFAMRYAKPVDGGAPGTASFQWRKNLPMVVLRVRDHSLVREAETYPAPVLEARTAWDERPLQPDLNNLASEIGRKWGQPCAAPNCPLRLLNLEAPPIGMIGPDCLPIGMNCFADTQDTIYELSTRLPLDNGEVYAIAGPLGTADTNATYVSIGINDTRLLKGAGEVSNEVLTDTALEFSGTVNNAEKFFVYYFTRDCSGLDALTSGHCLSITPDMIPVCSDAAACAPLGFSLRNYIRPNTERGPDPALTLPSVVVPLRRP